jgi:hypothetical protein
MTAVAGHDFDGEELANYSEFAAIPKDTLPEHSRLKAIESEFDRDEEI